MKTWKKVVLGLMVLGVLGFAGFVGYWMLTPNPDDLGNSAKYLTKEELTDLFWQNEELLNAVKDSVISSKGLLRAIDRNNEGDIGISFQGDKKYFSEEEWKDVLSVFENLHPYMLMLERKGRPLVFYMAFSHLNRGSTTYATYLYWFPNEQELAHHEKPGVFPDGVFTQLDEGWYVVETTEPRITIFD
ncbi:MAG TPA: hypothetical protein PKA81_09425 [Clostridia bacterium]|nr:hypothetical protein [Clostridia bacterium]